MSLDAFYELTPDARNLLLAFHGRAKSVSHTSEGFAGVIAFLDNGENTHPRFVVAKYPKLKKELAPGERARRFLREIELQASAHYHPNVHWPYDASLILGVPVAYFRRWEGDLSDYIERPDFGDLGRLSLTIQLVEGLVHCHLRGLAHQDLKPENVFIRDLQKSFPDLPNNDLWLRPLVADFGSVNLAAEVGEFSGTRPYMAPEQWAKTHVGEWTAVFAIGVILHELMSRGEHPNGEHGGAWHRKEKREYNRWQKNKLWRRWLGEGCPVTRPLPNRDLAEIVADCLKLDPRQRPTLEVVRDRLRSSLAFRSQNAADQVNLFLRMAQSQTTVDEWAHLKERIAHLRNAIETNFLEPE